MSPWELSTPDEGYLTSKETELPEMINSACKELECPICYEVGRLCREAGGEIVM